MKQNTFSLSLLFICSFAYADTNTFPASGNVGIGTLNPQPANKLQIEGGNAMILTASDFNGATYNPFGIGRNTVLHDTFLGLGTNQTNHYSYAQSQDAGSGYYSLALNPNGGNVGIGATNPGIKLSVGGGGGYTGVQIGTESGGAYLRWSREGRSSDANQLNIYDQDSGSVITSFKSGGNVGIGSTSPTYHLQVESPLDNQFQITGKGVGFGGSLLASIFSERTSAAPATDRLLRVGSAYAPDAFGVFGSGNVGIGTTAPAAKLHAFGIDDNVNGQVRIESSGSDARISLYNANGATATGRGDILMSRSSGYEGLRFMINNVDKMIIDETGNVGIGTTNPTQKLAVNGTIRAKEVIVDTGWSDYVFRPDYHLASLSEVEGAIQKDGHLPGIPSASEVAERGISVGEMQAKLLAKIEELTLHQIEQEKEIRALKNDLAEVHHKDSR